LKWDLEWELEGKLPPLSLYLFGFIATNKATVATIVAFFFGFFWICCRKEGDNNKLSLPSSVLVLLQ
jgi:hypothetical protein